MTRLSMLLLAGVAVGSMTPSKVFAQSPNAALSTIFPTEFVVEGCTEPVLLSGNIHSLFRLAFDRSGGFHLFFQSNPQGVTGVGLITGATYQGTGMSRQTHTFIDVPFTDTFISNFRIIGPGPDNNLQMHFNGHLTINANGEITASVDNFSSECG